MLAQTGLLSSDLVFMVDMLLNDDSTKPGATIKVLVLELYSCIRSLGSL